MLGELLGGIALGDVGLSGLVVFFVLAIALGWLVTKRVYDAAVENARVWQEVAAAQQEVNRNNTATLQELLAGQRASLHALQEIQAAGAYALAQRNREEST